MVTGVSKAVLFLGVGGGGIHVYIDEMCQFFFFGFISRVLDLGGLNFCPLVFGGLVSHSTIFKKLYLTSYFFLTEMET